ncbi:hypothetical protein A9Q99_16795 [Gammaproteobacteria bacterium 45_16_T64]|nr:hypothetical protein A9Q99_16795 [Gammaproteobacteria bacterium 45_16_T64]
MDIKSQLKPEEIQYFTAKSDTSGLLVILLNWSLIIAAFAIAGLWPSALTIIVSMILLAGRQLGLSVLMHECGHRSLFKSRQLNESIGRWLTAAPLFLDMNSYAKGHLVHHRNAGTEQDPDLNNYRNYPIQSRSLVRKFWRDITGQTALRLINAAHSTKSNVMNSPTRDPDSLVVRSNTTVKDGLIVNGALLLALSLCGAPWLYALWVIAYFTFYMLFLRIRQIAEHAAVPNLFDQDPRKNTRTTYANILERLLVAPNRVNYHLEHHILASVPIYKLPEFHQHLLSQGHYKETPIAPNYLAVLKQITTPATT